MNNAQTLSTKTIDPDILAFIDSLRRASAYIVGGWVRDALMGLPSSPDVDIEIYGLGHKELGTHISSYFSRSKIEYFHKFGIWKITHGSKHLSVSLPRTEEKYNNGHTGFTVTIDPNLTPDVAALRRDFTINAVMMKLPTGEIFDYAHGLRDIQNKTLRAVNINKIAEDPLRVWRAVQFIGRFNLEVEPKTEAVLCCMNNSEEVQNLPGARIREELDKLFIYAERPSRGLFIAYTWNLLAAHLSPLHALIESREWEEIERKLDTRTIQNLTELRQSRWQTLLKPLSPIEQKAVIAKLELPKKFRNI